MRLSARDDLVAPVARFVLRHKRAWVDAGLPDYPPWIAALIDSAALIAALVAAGQRWGDGLVVAIVLLAAALLPWMAELWAHARGWPLFVVLTGGGVLALMVLRPVDVDFAPLLLVLMAGHVTAVAGVVRGLVVTVAGEAVLVAVYAAGAMPVQELGIWVIAVAAGLDIGFIMRSQQLRLEAQEREHAVRERQAVLEERQRIAREVHDLVAHSLSVTMLHLTAARREVEDLAGGSERAPADATDAVEALREAERVGRRAMTDIRGAVGLLGRSDDADAVVAAPTLHDLPALVDDFRGAGLTIRYDVRGDLDGVPPATALGLYRIVQESLANVAKHASAAPVDLDLDLAADPASLTVRNPVLRGSRAHRHGDGSGLSGMAERAARLGAGLTAGPDGDGAWAVRVDLPLKAGPVAAPHCPLPRLLGST